MMRNRQVEETNSSQSMMELPEVIISDILSRLPLKTICRFRCISKSWHRLLLSDPYFAQLHLSRSHHTNNTLISKHPERRELYMINLHESTLSTPLLGPLKISPKFYQLASNMKPIASCNGLILFGNNRSYLVCNPIMGQYMNIPKPIKKIHFYNGCFGGFGFSPSTKQYKIMHLWTYDHTPYEAEIHTLGTDMWRIIGGFVPEELALYSRDAYLNGALHWIAYTHDGVYINCFDLGSERFECFPGPRSLENVCMLNLCFGVSGEQLYIIDSARSATLDVWIMKNYGVKESWTKEFVINPVNIRCKCHVKDRVKILNYGTSSVLLVRCGSKYGKMPLVAYNLETKSVSDVRFSLLFCQYFEVQLPHVPSFVSLKDAVIDGENFQIDEFGCVSKLNLCNVQIKQATPVQIKQATPYLDAPLSNIVPTTKG